MQTDFIACTTADAISTAILAFGYPLCSSDCTAREPGIKTYFNFHNTSRYIAIYHHYFCVENTRLKQYHLPKVNDNDVQHIATTSRLPYESLSFGKNDLAA